MKTETPTTFRYDLWNFFVKNHGLILTDSELVDVIEAVKTQLKKEQSTMKLTPLHLEILSHHLNKEDGNIQICTNELTNLGLLEFDNASGFYSITDKGKAWLEHVLETPMPTMKWTWE